jgi:hypothetical protein
MEKSILRERSIFACFMMIFFLQSIPASSQSLTVTVGAGADDMEESVADGKIDAGSSDLEMVMESSAQIIGLRFTNITIPQGATITKAYIQFTADGTDNEATVLKLEGEAVDNSAQFTSADMNVSSRPRTTAFADWTVEPWAIVQERGAPQQTPDMKAVIQEIINRSGWTSGNAIGVIISGTGKRKAESFEGATSGDLNHAANQAPTLVVEYTVPATIGAYTNPTQISLYPNPATTEWNISLPENNNDTHFGSKAVLYDIYGRQVWSNELREAGSSILIVPAASLSKGVYILHLNVDGTMQALRLNKN